MPLMSRKFPNRRLKFVKKLGVAKKSTRAIAKRAERSVKAIKRNFEKKYFNSSYTTAYATAGDVVELTNIAQGDTAITRDGNSISVRSIRMLHNIALVNPAAGPVPEAISGRLIVFQDKQQVADTAPAVTDVLLSASVTSPYNYPAVNKRFKILYDKMFRLDPQTPGSAGAVNSQEVKRTWKHWIFPTMKNVSFNGAAATDLEKNQLYMLVIRDTAVAGNQIMLPTTEWQVCFTDN